MINRTVTELPIIGITLGDIAGIGPEVVIKALQHPEVYEICRPLVIGDSRVRGLEALNAETLPHSAAVEAGAPGGATARDARDRWWQGIYWPLEGPLLLDLRVVDPSQVAVGEVSPVAGRAAVAYVLSAVRLAQAGVIDAVATAPLNKEAMRLAGYDYIGHTEILADVTGSPRCTTMLATPGLRVAHVTRHIPFRDIAIELTRERILDTIVVTDEGMRDLGYAHPRLAVAGLNPHNGEGGLIGREEIDEIAPAVEAAQRMGMDVTGPIPADSVFFQTIRGDYDVVVAMYHDQGHIAVKTHGFEQSITITLGLPIVRTSADHGTAFDIAGKGIASESSMLAAILEAATIAQRRAAS
jgi:4-phospho-D-threonate 3-dehydrogenase / 4-phospho-D-erythronate 3-dehydrogenase